MLASRTSWRCTPTTAIGLVAALGFSLGSSGPAAAQTAPPSMLLEQAIQYALDHNPGLTAAQAQVVEGTAAREGPIGRWLPRLGASAQFLAATDNGTSAAVITSNPSIAIPRVSGTSYDPSLSLANHRSWNPYANSFIGVGVSQQVFDFGRTAAEIAGADATLLAEHHDLERSLLDTRLDVTVSFLAVQVAHEIVTAATSAVERADAQRDQAAALVHGQLRSRIYLDRAQAELSRLRIGLLRSQAGLAVAESDLAVAVGFDQPLLDARGMPLAPGTMPTAGEAVAAATRNDPGLKALAARVEAQRHTAEGIAGVGRPAIYVSGTVSLSSGGAPSSGATPQLSGFLPETPNWDVGLVASWTFFDPVVLAQARAAHAEEAVLRAQLESARQALMAAVQTLWQDGVAAEQALPELQKAFEAARSNYDQAKVRFGQGLGTSVEIADAETLLTQSQVELAQGQFGLARVHAQLERAMAGGL